MCSRCVCVNRLWSQVCAWLNERNAVALDESWREPINLQAKVLKHQSFEAEILANRYRVDALIQVSVGPSGWGHVTERAFEPTDALRAGGGGDAVG